MIKRNTEAVKESKYQILLDGDPFHEGYAKSSIQLINIERDTMEAVRTM